MRKTPAALTLLALAGAALTGCSVSSAAEAACDRDAGADASLTDLVTVSGEFGSLPEVDMRAPFHVDGTSYVDVIEGDGQAITTMEQAGTLDMALYDGETGELLTSTSYSGDTSQIAALTQWSQMFPGFESALSCATEGSRVVAALDPDDIEESFRAQLQQVGVPEGSSIVAVVDVRRVYPASASGELVYNTGWNLPSVVRDADGRPGIVVPDAEAPDDLVVQTLIEGDGAELTADDTAVVHYTGVLWDEKTVFDSSWENGSPAAFPLTGVIEGFQKGLVGQKVGSQVMLVVPADLGYGDEGSGAVPAGATLVFVVDILGVQDAAQQ